jgi:F-type H+-transporting ATPase subunit epsilon
MLKLTVVTPEKKLVTDAEIDDVLVPAFAGELNILPGHAPLMTTLSTGIVQFKRKGSTVTERIFVSWGYCEVANDVINILAETAETTTEIDVTRAEEAFKRSDKALSGNVDGSEMEKYRLKRERALVRIAASRMNH